MGSRHETTALLRDGIPLTEIAAKRERSITTVIQHLRMQLGEGDVRPMEVILAFAGDRGTVLDNLFLRHRHHTFRTFEKYATSCGFHREEAKLYHDVRRSDALRGDIYVLISDIEIGLHVFIKDELVSRFGSDEVQWWRQGVPDTVRKDCVRAREEDPDPTEPYRYTTFIHLSDIIKSNWPLFQYTFRKLEKNKLLQDLRHLNSLRNAVMHPVKQKQWTREHLEVLRQWHRTIRSIESLRHPSPKKWISPLPTQSQAVSDRQIIVASSEIH